MRIELEGQVALVTGSAHRVGKAIALELARRGVNILVHYNSAADDVVKDTLRDLRSHGVDAFAIQADISRPDGVEQTFAAVREHFGRLHILVNSASNFQKRKFSEVTLTDWEDTLRINVTAPFLCTQAALPLMRANTPAGGSIVNICDLSALMPSLDYPHHGVSKAALHMLTQVSANSLGEENIRVNAIVPGLVLKPSDYSDEAWTKAAQKIPLRRAGTAEDVGRAVVYLCEEDWLTGITVRVDGGEHFA
jgi:NAD(P)-dependent dehydrogenase (short-subunit alcohol dehydrogenase family)